MAQHEVRELIAEPKYSAHETCLGLNFSNNSLGLNFSNNSHKPCDYFSNAKLYSFTQMSFVLELKLFLKTRFALTITFILYLRVLGLCFLQWHLATSLTRRLTFFFFFFF